MQVFPARGPGSKGRRKTHFGGTPPSREQQAELKLTNITLLPGLGKLEGKGEDLDKGGGVKAHIM